MADKFKNECVSQQRNIAFQDMKEFGHLDYMVKVV